MTSSATLNYNTTDSIPHSREMSVNKRNYWVINVSFRKAGLVECFEERPPTISSIKQRKKFLHLSVNV